jgi:hypothetical protein
MFFRKTSLAIARHLQPRLRLRLFDLRARSSFTRGFLAVLGLEQRPSRRRYRLGARGQRFRERSALFVEAHERFAELVSSNGQPFSERVGFLDLALCAVTSAIELALVFGGATRVDLSGFQRRRCFGDSLFRFLNRGAQRVGGRHGFLPRTAGDRELGTQREQLGAPTQWSRAADAAGEPDRAARVDERRAVVDGLRPTK